MQLEENYQRADLGTIISMIRKPNSLSFLDRSGKKVASIILEPKQIMLRHTIGWSYADEAEVQILRELYAKFKS
jgi:hypothetical protein